MNLVDKHILAEKIALEISDLKKGFDREEEKHFNRTNLCLYDEIYASVIIGFESRDADVEDLKKQVLNLQEKIDFLVQELSLIEEPEKEPCKHIRKNKNGMIFMNCPKCGEYIYTGN